MYYAVFSLKFDCVSVFLWLVAFLRSVWGLGPYLNDRTRPSHPYLKYRRRQSKDQEERERERERERPPPSHPYLNERRKQRERP